jgi:hypothetical protein
MISTFKMMPVAFAALIIVSASYAYAATGTVPHTQAGDGAGAITGYAVTNVVYQLNADPAKVDSVSFTLNAAAGTVKIKLVDDGSTWYDCVIVENNDWSCVTTGATTKTIDSLRVVAASH